MHDRNFIRHRLRDFWQHLPLVLLVVICLVGLFISWHNYVSMRFATDGYRYYRVLINTLEGRFMHEGPYWGFLWAYHQFLLLPLLLPLPLLWSSPFVLLVCTHLLALLGAWQVYLLVKRYARLSGGQAAFWAVAYYMQPTLLSSLFGYDSFLFQNESFYLFLIPLTVRLWLAQNRWLWLAVFFTCLVKEEGYFWFAGALAAGYFLRRYWPIGQRAQLSQFVRGILLALLCTLSVIVYAYVVYPAYDHRQMPIYWMELTPARFAAAFGKIVWVIGLPLLLLYAAMASKTKALSALNLLGRLVLIFAGFLGIRTLITMLFFGLDWNIVYTHVYWGNLSLQLWGFVLVLMFLARYPVRIPRGLQVLILGALLGFFLWQSARTVPGGGVGSLVSVQQPQKRMALASLVPHVPTPAGSRRALIISDETASFWVNDWDVIFATHIPSGTPTQQARWWQQTAALVLTPDLVRLLDESHIRDRGFVPIAASAPYTLYAHQELLPPVDMD